jgi:hypothetical protein
MMKGNKDIVGADPWSLMMLIPAEDTSGRAAKCALKCLMHLLGLVRRFRAATLVALAGIMALPAIALAQNDDISISIAKHAQLTSDGAVIVRIHIACDPLPGTEDFQEALAGAGQAKTGAEAEGGIDGTVVCDGISHTHTARLSPFTDAVFKRGPASASASLVICNLVGDEQVCVQGATERRIIIRGPLVP